MNSKNNVSFELNSNCVLVIWPEIKILQTIKQKCNNYKFVFMICSERTVSWLNYKVIKTFFSYQAHLGRTNLYRNFPYSAKVNKEKRERKMLNCSGYVSLQLFKDQLFKKKGFYTLFFFVVVFLLKWRISILFLFT